MNILFVTHYVELFGANRSLLVLIEGFREKGINITILAPSEGPFINRARQLGCEVVFGSIHYWVLPRNELKKYNIKGRIYLLWREVKYIFCRNIEDFSGNKIANHYSLIYTNSSVTSTGVAIAWKLKLPHVWHIREYCDLDYNFKFICGKRISILIMLFSSKIIFVSNALAHYFLGRVFCRMSNIIYNGAISVNSPYLQQKSIISNNGILNLLMLGFIHKQKGFDVAIRALGRINAQSQKITLTIAGSGSDEYLEELRSLISNLGLEDSVHFLGYKNNPFDLYLNCDGLVMASYAEAMGRVTVEAMIMGLPVLGRDSGATPELIEHKISGYLWRGDDVELAKAMEWVLAHRKEWVQMGSNARTKAMKLFTAENYVNKVLNVIKK